jgi:hypothetical protein
MDIPTLDFFFRCTVDDCQKAQANDDAAELMWVSLADLQTEKFGLQSIRRGVDRFLKNPE